MGVGGFAGYRIYWPAGFETMTPAERAEALERGWWDVPTDDPIRFERLYVDGQKITVYRQPNAAKGADGGDPVVSAIETGGSKPHA